LRVTSSFAAASAKRQHGYQSTLLLLLQVAWHDTLLPQQPLQGRQAVAAVFKWLHVALSDLQLQVAEVVSVEDHHILLYYTAAGTHTGPLHSSLGQHSCTPQQQQQQQQDFVEPTGKPASWTGSLVLRMQPDSAAAAGMAAVVAWHSWDPLFLYQQVGLRPSSAVPEAPPAAPVVLQDVPAGPAVPQAAAGPAVQAVQPAAAAAAAAAAEECSQPEACKKVVQQYFDIYNSGEQCNISSKTPALFG
jgi:hypothetical protein